MWRFEHYRSESGRSDTAGFTILEVTFVLLIAGIFFVGLAPGIKRISAGTNLVLAADRMAADIRVLQQRALSEQSAEYFITFNPAPENTYRLKQSRHPVAETIAFVRLPEAVELDTTNFESAGRRHMLLVSAKGKPSPRGGAITLRNKMTGQVKYVIIASITGRVRVSDSPPKNWE